MILFFDNYVTDKSLGTIYKGLDKVRKSKTIYQKKTRKEICAYTLYSYSKIKFDFCLLNIKTDKKNDFFYLKNICKKNFKNKIDINNFRSDNKKSFENSLSLLKKSPGNKWIFVAGNTDHPIITHDLNFLYKSVEFANKFLKISDYVSIICSHQVEYLNNMTDNNLVITHLNNFAYKKIYEDNSYLVLKLNPGHKAHTLAIQIMSLKMLTKLINSTDFTKKIIFRTDEMNGKSLKDHIIIVPKNKICDHYDGYSHLPIFGCYLPLKKYPPLFMPDKFFSKKFNVFYGFKKRFKNGVNINPFAKNFSFEDEKKGTDLKVDIAKIPFFWKTKINKILINKNIVEAAMISKADSIKNDLLHPYPKKNMFLIKLFICYRYLKKKFFEKKNKYYVFFKRTINLIN
jgi:hypothetical protein